MPYNTSNVPGFSYPAFASLPLILCGPILRRVESDAVTVWLALKSAKRVKLKIKDNAGTLLYENHLDTIAIGANLHVVAVTCDKMALTSGNIYRYDLDFNPSGGGGLGIAFPLLPQGY